MNFAHINHFFSVAGCQLLRCWLNPLVIVDVGVWLPTLLSKNASATSPTAQVYGRCSSFSCTSQHIDTCGYRKYSFSFAKLTVIYWDMTSDRI